jgi:hypothetical protein
MLAQYPAVYRDSHGEEVTVVRNDGETLRMTVRGVEFVSKFVDDWEPTITLDASALTAFSLHNYPSDDVYLSDFVVAFDMPLPVEGPEGVREATLHVRLDFRSQIEGASGGAPIVLTLSHNGKEYPSSGKDGWFEYELMEIQQALPEGVYMKACINCAFSDYSVAGSSAFGGMLCFWGSKDEYLAVRNKSEYSRMEGRYTQQVQETYLCPEFRRRVPGTGYRG